MEGMTKTRTPSVFCWKLVFLYGSANRACACASTALDALVSIDDELAVGLADATDGALGLAAATSDAIIVNDVSHGFYTSYVHGLSLL